LPVKRERRIFVAKLPHRHFYLSALRLLRKFIVEAYSFLHGKTFFPSWGFFLSIMEERKNPHGGKNKYSDEKD
jgi:hypothetical protein